VVIGNDTFNNYDNSYCVAIGYKAGQKNRLPGNTFLGYAAGANNNTFWNCTFIGESSGLGNVTMNATGNYQIILGNNYNSVYAPNYNTYSD